MLFVKWNEVNYMAKYTKSYENGIEKHELEFRENIFDFSMLPSVMGYESDKNGFEYQIPEKYPDITTYMLEGIGVDYLWCEDDREEIFEILDSLKQYE